MTEEYNVESRSDVSLDNTFAVLSHAYRRRILSLLVQHGPRKEFTVDDLIRSDDDQNVALSLHHNHLPKLDRIGFIEWDREANTIGRGSNFEEIRPVLELLVEGPEELADGW